MILCVERGAFQGFERYRVVALDVVERGRVANGVSLLLVGVGLDVTGAFAGAALAFVAVALVLLVPLGAELPPPDGRRAGEARLRGC